MKFLFDLFPVILFFVAYKFAGIYVATSVAIAASVMQVAWLKLRRKKVDPMLWASLAIIVVFGGATLALQDEMFIKWKPTVLSKELQLPDVIWTRLNWSWSGFFALMGIANLYVAYNYSTDRWVDFKVFGGSGLILVFIVAQALLIAKYVDEKPPIEEKR